MTRAEFFQNILGATAVASVDPVGQPEVIEIAERADVPKLFALKLSNRYPLGNESIARIHELLKPYEDQFNCKFLILQQDVDIVRVV